MADEQTTQGDGAQTSETTTQQTADTSKTFTEDEVNRIVQERLSREKGKYADYNELKKAADELKQIKDASKSELEKLQARLVEIEKANEEAQTALLSERKTAKVARIAGSLDACDPLDPNFLLAIEGIDAIAESADAEIKERLEALKKTKPYLFKAAGTQLASFNPGDSGGSAETDKQRIERVRNQQGIGNSPLV